MRFPGWFAILVGAAMLGQWTLFLGSGTVTELKTEPVRIAFHLAAELLTAILLLLSGAGVLRSQARAKSLLLLALGMLVYTSIASPGYFAQKGQMGLVIMFGTILALACAAIASILRSAPRPADPG